MQSIGIRSHGDSPFNEKTVAIMNLQLVCWERQVLNMGYGDICFFESVSNKHIESYI